MIDEEFNNKIVEGIKKLRHSLELTQKEFGEKLELSESYVIHWENKQDKVSLKNLLKICETFDCSLDYIFGINEESINLNETAETAYESIFDIEFPFIDNEDNPMLILNFTTNKYILEYYYKKKLLDKEKEENIISDKEYAFELEELKEKYSEAFTNELNKKVSYNCTMTNEE